MDTEDDQEKCLDLIQRLHTESQINDDQRNILKDMLFDEDAILLSFFSKYTEPDEQEELSKQVIKYGRMNCPELN